MNNPNDDNINRKEQDFHIPSTLRGKVKQIGDDIRIISPIQNLPHVYVSKEKFSSISTTCAILHLNLLLMHYKGDEESQAVIEGFLSPSYREQLSCFAMLTTHQQYYVVALMVTEYAGSLEKTLDELKPFFNSDVNQESK